MGIGQDAERPLTPVPNFSAALSLVSSSASVLRSRYSPLMWVNVDRPQIAPRHAGLNGNHRSLDGGARDARGQSRRSGESLAHAPAQIPGRNRSAPPTDADAG